VELSYLRELFELQLEASVSERTNTDQQSVLTLGAIRAIETGMQVGNAGELLEFADGTLGMALNLEQNAVGAACFTTAIDADILEGTIVLDKGQVVEIPVGEAYCGRIVNALCEPIGGAGMPQFADGTLGMALNLEQNAVGAMIFTIAIDAIINQKDCLCVYVAVGQKASTLAQIASTLGQHDSLAITSLVTALFMQATAESNQDIGSVLTIGDGIARVAGMQECMAAITSLVTALFEGMQQVAGQR
jgi:F-type H+-transporting ATPase subunit alpha